MTMLRFLLLATLFATPVHADEVCELARPMAQKAAKTFETNQAEGLKLFIKARELCPSDPAYAYNLGAAYYRYGRLDEARPLLEEAARAKNAQPLWRNNLAQLLLDLGEATPALKHAEAAARAGGEPAFAETLARARFAAGQPAAALRGLLDERRKKDSKLLTDTYASLLD